MEAIPWGFESPLSHLMKDFFCAVSLFFCLSCVKTGEEVASEINSEASSGVVSQKLLELFVPASRKVVENASLLLQRTLLLALRNATEEPKMSQNVRGLVVSRRSGNGLFLVPDGHDLKVDLALSPFFTRHLQSMQYEGGF